MVDFLNIFTVVIYNHGKLNWLAYETICNLQAVAYFSMLISYNHSKIIWPVLKVLHGNKDTAAYFAIICF